MEIEEYKSCFENYEISNFGNLRRKLYSGKYININGSLLNRGSGYKYFQINRDNKRTNLLFHCLVAKAFIGDRPSGLVIDHIDRNSLNNNVNNLRYITQKENTHNTYRYKNHIEGKGKERHLKVSKEWRDNNKEHLKKYREQNKEHIKETSYIYNKYRYNKNREILLKKSKEWQNNNKEYRKEYMKEWQNNNSEIIICECGSKYKKYDKSHHIKTKKHNLYLVNIDDNK
jgi:hypothetical protein